MKRKVACEHHADSERERPDDLQKRLVLFGDLTRSWRERVTRLPHEWGHDRVEEQTANGRVYEEEQEELFIGPSNAVARPRTVVIHAIDAASTHGAVMHMWRLQCVTALTVARVLVVFLRVVVLSVFHRTNAMIQGERGQTGVREDRERVAPEHEQSGNHVRHVDGRRREEAHEPEPRAALERHERHGGARETRRHSGFLPNGLPIGRKRLFRLTIG